MAIGPVSLLPSRREYLHINVFPSCNQVADGPFFVINPDRISEDHGVSFENSAPGLNGA